MNFGHQGLSEKVERIAKAICKDASDPFRFEEAIIIAESEILVTRVRAVRLAAIERWRNNVRPGDVVLPGCLALGESGLLRDISGGNLRKATQLINRSTREYKTFRKVLLAKMTATDKDMRLALDRQKIAWGGTLGGNRSIIVKRLSRHPMCPPGPSGLAQPGALREASPIAAKTRHTKIRCTRAVTAATISCVTVNMQSI